MERQIALAILLFWTIIPIFWIPVHLFPAFFRRLRLLTYLTVPALWIPVAWFVYSRFRLFISPGIHLPIWLGMAGLVLFLAGIMLHAWTILVLGVRIIGLPQVYSKINAGLVSSGPFRYSRHPTYLAHSMIFFGAAMYIGYWSLWAVAILDLVITQAVIIPIEEKEMETRFGEPFSRYREKTPRLFPWPFLKRK